MRQHAKIIVNPTAGAGSTRRKWPEIRSLFRQSGLSFEYELTEDKGHAIDLARKAAGNGHRYVIAVGGDGTIHEVANGIMQAGGSGRTVLGTVCTGTGSDLCRSVGTPRDYRQACASLAQGKSKRIDVGLVEYRRDGASCERYFLNSAGIGFDAAVVEATEKLPKYFGGTIPYLFGLVRTLLGYRNKKVIFRRDTEEPEREEVVSMVVANGSYFGGGMRVAPDAMVDDGLFDVVIIGNMGKVELLRVFPRIYKGTHIGHHKVRVERDKEVTIESSQRFLLQADGELLGEGPVRFTLLPRFLDLVV